MELFLGWLGLVVFSVTISAFEEHIRWEEFYYEAGEEDRLYHLDKQNNFEIDYRE